MIMNRLRLLAATACTLSSLLAMPVSAATLGGQVTPLSAFNALYTTTSSITSLGIDSQITQLHDAFKAYQWRTVYALSQVSKSPLPGTRLGIVAQPTMSQLDAENYLNQVVFGGQLPALNCPVAQMGGSAGRTMTLTDAQILTALTTASGDAAKALVAYNVFYKVKTNVCAAIYNTAQLQSRLDQYTNLRNNWTECSTNGIQLTAWTIGNTFEFDNGNYVNVTRSINIGGGILYKCGAVYTGATTDPLTYDSWFKWTDNDPFPLNFYKLIKEATDTPATSCPSLCIPVVGAESVSAKLCVGVSPGVSAITGDTVPLKLGFQINYRNASKTLCTPVINVPAPFGVAQSLGEMADSAKTNALTSMKSQFTSLLSPTMGNLLSNIAVVKATLP
jgi:hypothetical protein